MAAKTPLATTRSRIVLAVQRFVLRTQKAPLGAFWELAYRGMARLAAGYLTGREPGASTYVRGSLATDELIAGLSDIDLVVVFGDRSDAPDRAAARARARSESLHRRVPLSGLLLDWPRTLDVSELRDLVGASALTYGLADSSRGERDRAAYFGRGAGLDRVRMLERPGLYGATADWRPLTGPDLRPSEPARDRHAVLVAAWLELAYWWRWAFLACVAPRGPRTALQCVKLIAEPARIWLWLAHGERVAERVDALERARRLLPEEENAFSEALELHRDLDKLPEPPLDTALSALVRMTERVTALISHEPAGEDPVEVQLAGADPVELIVPGATPDWKLLPLVDWRALVCPELADESFAPLSGEPADPARIAALARSTATPYAALRSGGVMVMPADSLPRSRLRSVKCALTDPVSFALADGAGRARFPQVGGWSARAGARRAVAEHRDWLGSAPAPADAPDLGMLFTAARAALLSESLDEGDPVLALTVTEIARRLAARSAADRTVAEAALEAHRTAVRTDARPPADVVAAMRALVTGLPAYA